MNSTEVVSMMWWGEKPHCERVNGRGRNEVNNIDTSFGFPTPSVVIFSKFVGMPWSNPGEWVMVW